MEKLVAHGLELRERRARIPFPAVTTRSLGRGSL